MSAKTTGVYAVTYAGKTVEIEFDDVLYQAACRGSDYWQMKFRGKVVQALGLGLDQPIPFFELEVERVRDAVQATNAHAVRRARCGCTCSDCNSMRPKHCSDNVTGNCWVTPR